jgi:hypothetical protein
MREETVSTKLYEFTHLDLGLSTTTPLQNTEYETVVPWSSDWRPDTTEYFIFFWSEFTWPHPVWSHNEYEKNEKQNTDSL